MPGARSLGGGICALSSPDRIATKLLEPFSFWHEQSTRTRDLRIQGRLRAKAAGCCVVPQNKLSRLQKLCRVFVASVASLLPPFSSMQVQTPAASPGGLRSLEGPGCGQSFSPSPVLFPSPRLSAHWPELPTPGQRSRRAAADRSPGILHQHQQRGRVHPRDHGSERKRGL